MTFSAKSSWSSAPWKVRSKQNFGQNCDKKTFGRCGFWYSDGVAYDDADNVFILDVPVGVGPAGFSAIAPWLSTEIQLPHMNTHPIVVIIILVELMINVWLWGSSGYIGDPASPIKRSVSRVSRYKKPNISIFPKKMAISYPFCPNVRQIVKRQIQIVLSFFLLKAGPCQLFLHCCRLSLIFKNSL